MMNIDKVNRAHHTPCMVHMEHPDIGSGLWTVHSDDQKKDSCNTRMGKSDVGLERFEALS